MQLRHHLEEGRCRQRPPSILWFGGFCLSIVVLTTSHWYLFWGVNKIEPCPQNTCKRPMLLSCGSPLPPHPQSKQVYSPALLQGELAHKKLEFFRS